LGDKDIDENNLKADELNGKDGHKKKQRCPKDNSGSSAGIQCTKEVMYLYSRIRGKESIMEVILALKGGLNTCS
jgi:hypothetical protein